MTKEMTGAEMVIQALADQGVQHIFGYPGGAVLPIYDALFHQEQVRHILSELLQRGDVHDDVLQTHLVSITEVRMSPDLRHATVFVKPLLGQDEEAVLKALRQNTAFLQREVAHRVRMKYAAKLKFVADESFDEGTHIDRLLRSEKVAQDLDHE